jgi:DNA (cytosine-5)-methyltransferase 1
MLSKNPFSGIYKAETSRTLDTNGGNPALNQGGLMIVEPQIARTLTARGDSSPCADRGQNIVAIGEISVNSLTPWENQSSKIFSKDGAAPTLSGADGGGRNPGGLVMTETHPTITGTLCAGGAGLSRPAGNANETDLCVAYCLQGNMIGRKDENGPQGTGVSEELAYTISSADRHCVAAVDCRNLNEGEVKSAERYKPSVPAGIL